jgi:uncharacterized protein YigE (DUF2233 family)
MDFKKLFRKRNPVAAFVAIGIMTMLLELSVYKDDGNIMSYEADTSKHDVMMFWENDKGARYGSLGKLATHIESSGIKLKFATNGGMYKKDHSPQGLYIEAGKMLSFMDTDEGNGNFYLKPNGIFYIDGKEQGFVCKTEDYKPSENINYATQSGPMLVIDGKIHPAFKRESTNLNIRSGVGILPNGHVFFAISKKEINFYDFAQYFVSAGCKNALYLDGFVSRVYCPERKWEQSDGDFGVIIAVTEKKGY